MKTLLFLAAAVLLSCGTAGAATITNADGEAVVVEVAEGGTRMRLAVPPGGTEWFCPRGCFISWGDGDRAALFGDEELVIRDGAVRFPEDG